MKSKYTIKKKNFDICIYYDGNLKYFDIFLEIDEENMYFTRRISELEKIIKLKFDTKDDDLEKEIINFFEKYIYIDKKTRIKAILLKKEIEELMKKYLIRL